MEKINYKLVTIYLLDFISGLEMEVADYVEHKGRKIQITLKDNSKKEVGIVKPIQEYLFEINSVKYKLMQTVIEGTKLNDYKFELLADDAIVWTYKKESYKRLPTLHLKSTDEVDLTYLKDFNNSNPALFEPFKHIFEEMQQIELVNDKNDTLLDKYEKMIVKSE